MMNIGLSGITAVRKQDAPFKKINIIFQDERGHEVTVTLNEDVASAMATLINHSDSKAGLVTFYQPDGSGFVFHSR